MFADIAGFTSGALFVNHAGLYAPRNLYGAFDAIAKGVFKVETIGDSYVAVVGLPTPKGSCGCNGRFASDATQ
jgi:class 3 adenylate cyclase